MEKTNRKEIPFNFELWGKEDNIMILFGQFEVANIMKSTTDDVFCVEYKHLDGSNRLAFISQNDLTMYQEVKPREIYLNEFEGRFQGRTYYPSKGDANDNVSFGGTRQVKFIEVLEEE